MPKTSFIEALEEFLAARDRYHEVYRDQHTSGTERWAAGDRYDEASFKLEEAHRISLMDIIAEDNDVAQ